MRPSRPHLCKDGERCPVTGQRSSRTLRCVLLNVWSPTPLGFSEESENHPGLAQREAGAGWTAWLKAAETWDLQSGASCMSVEGRELGLLRVGDRKKIW